MALTIANKITVGRILIVPFFLSAILYYAPEKDHLRFIAFGLFMVAVISDVIDGYLARVRKEKTRTGAILDPLADKLLLISAFIVLYIVGVKFPHYRFPLWLVVTVISRDVILLIGTLLISIAHGMISIEATPWGKASTFFQVLCVMAMLLQWPYTWFLWYITVFFAVVSCLDYIRIGSKIINTPEGEIKI